MTPDKDLGACLRGERVVQVDRRQQKVTDEAAFRAARGFGPRSMPDFLALTGDTADGIPGLAGFGERSAASVVGAYEHLENIPEHAHQWSVQPRGALRLATTLAAEREEALLYRKLATLVEDVPLAEVARRPGVPRRPPRALRGLVRRARRDDAEDHAQALGGARTGAPHPAPGGADLSRGAGEVNDQKHRCLAGLLGIAARL